MEEVEIGETPNDYLKEIELIEGNIKYRCEIQKDDDKLYISVQNNKIKIEGQIHIYYIQYQLGILNYNIDDIFNSIYILNNNKFKLIKDNNKYQMQIELIILSERRYINIELYDNINNNNDEYIKEIIKAIENKIKLFNEELNRYKNMNKDIYDNFIIGIKNLKKHLNIIQIQYYVQLY